MKQQSLGLGQSMKRTRRREFLSEMERVVSWTVLVALVSPYMPESRRGRPPFPVEVMLRIHFGGPVSSTCVPQALTVLGLPRPDDADPDQSLRALPIPSWARNGSFLVLCGLRQDVDGYWRTMREEAARLAACAAFPELDAVRLASMLVGRWPSDAPFVLSPAQDDPALAKSNDFAFGYADPSSLVCLFAAQIREVKPRRVPVELGGPRGTPTCRFLRRGIPYSEAPDDRGLIFISYQSSIENQLEFVCRQWANRNDLPMVPPGGEAGIDTVIGQNADDDRRRWTHLFRPDTGAAVAVKLPQDFVKPTGGGYFFAPSISTLRRWSGALPQ